jgi:hypothetical protein
VPGGRGWDWKRSARLEGMDWPPMRQGKAEKGGHWGEGTEFECFGKCFDVFCFEFSEDCVGEVFGEELDVSE